MKAWGNTQTRLLWKLEYIIRRSLNFSVKSWHILRNQKSQQLNYQNHYYDTKLGNIRILKINDYSSSSQCQEGNKSFIFLLQAGEYRVHSVEHLHRRHLKSPPLIFMSTQDQINLLYDWKKENGIYLGPKILSNWAYAHLKI